LFCIVSMFDVVVLLVVGRNKMSRKANYHMIGVVQHVYSKEWHVLARGWLVYDQ